MPNTNDFNRYFWLIDGTIIWIRVNLNGNEGVFFTSQRNKIRISTLDSI